MVGIMISYGDAKQCLFAFACWKQSLLTQAMEESDMGYKSILEETVACVRVLENKLMARMEFHDDKVYKQLANYLFTEEEMKETLAKVQLKKK